MRYLILTLSLIIGLATSVSANDKPFAVGDVFFCQMEEYVVWEWSDKKLEQFKKEKFKFTIADSEIIKFGEGGIMNNFEMRLVAFSGRGRQFNPAQQHHKNTQRTI